MPTRLTLATFAIMLFGLGFGTLVQTSHHGGHGAFAGRTAADCFPEGAFCHSSVAAGFR